MHKWGPRIPLSKCSRLAWSLQHGLPLTSPLARSIRVPLLRTVTHIAGEIKLVVGLAMVGTKARQLHLSWCSSQAQWSCCRSPQGAVIRAQGLAQGHYTAGVATNLGS